MAKTYLVNGQVYIGRAFEKKTLCMDEGKLTVLEAGCDTADGTVFDAQGLKVVPGFIDTHTHGAVGVDVNGATAEDLEKISCFMASKGTTSWLCSVLTDTQEQTEWCIEQFKAHKVMEQNGAELAGIHLEGPFLAKEYKGAMMITVAPEVEGGMNVGVEAAKRGIVASVAHSNADYSVIEKALSYGYSDVTHIYSACSGMKKVGIFRVAGVVEAGLSLPGYTTQFIGDLRHLPYGVLKLIHQAKGADKAYAISDGLEYSALDMTDGTVIMQENGLEVLFEDNVMKLADRSCLAGSVATSNVLVKNMYKTAGIPLVDAVRMASLTPLSVIGFDKTKGRIKEGYDEDIILFDEEVNVSFVCVNGKIIKNSSS